MIIKKIIHVCTQMVYYRKKDKSYDNIVARFIFEIMKTHIKYVRIRC